MIDSDSEIFIKAIENNDVEVIKSIPKGELHNHSALGIDRMLLKDIGIEIPNIAQIKSIEEMDNFSKKYISKLTKTEEGYKLLIEGTVISTINDGITVLETSIDYRFFKFYDNNIFQGLQFLESLKNKYKNKLNLKYDIGLSRKSFNIQYEGLIIELIDSKIFSGIDLYGDEAYNDLEKFKKIYKYAKKNNMKLKAHVGEFGSDVDIVKTIKYLDLDVVQHGINIINSSKAMEYAKNKGIVFNVCPTSNVILNRVKNIKEHPIRKMYEVGLKITINTDDLLLFNSTLSNEYIKLFNNNVLNAKQLNDIRIESLKD